MNADKRPYTDTTHRPLLFWIGVDQAVTCGSALPLIIQIIAVGYKENGLTADKRG
jgi:hypothetical protein